MNAFDEMAASGSLLGIAMQTPGLTMDLVEVFNDTGDANKASRHSGLLEVWTDAAPESRAAVLMSFAWRSREAGEALPEGETPAGMYAHDLNTYAREHEGDSESFHGRQFPAMPLPGKAGALAASIAFDRDDCDITLKTALLLLAARPPGPAGDGS